MAGHFYRSFPTDNDGISRYRSSAAHLVNLVGNLFNFYLSRTMARPDCVPPIITKAKIESSTNCDWPPHRWIGKRAFLRTFTYYAKPGNDLQRADTWPWRTFHSFLFGHTFLDARQPPRRHTRKSKAKRQNRLSIHKEIHNIKRDRDHAYKNKSIRMVNYMLIYT